MAARKKQKPAQRRRLRLWLFRGCLVVLSLIIAEIMLRVLCVVSLEVRAALTPASPWAGIHSVVPDERLRHRGNPRVPEHDPLGFRNDDLPAKCDIVTIGDSQTYGTSVESYQAWPKQLAHDAGLSVYDMSCSGWGPVQYREMARDAFRLKPRLIVVGLYLGNDIFDSYRDAYELPVGPDLRSSPWRDEIRKVETAKPSLSEIGKLASRSKFGDEWVALPSTQAGFTAAQIVAHCRLAALGEATYNSILGLKHRQANKNWSKVCEWARSRPDDAYVVDSGSIRTVLTIPYRGFAVDIDDVRIQDGLRITLRLIDDISALCRANECGLLVLLIPTKETATQEIAMPEGRTAAYEKLLSGEKTIKQRLEGFLDEKAISHVDASSAIQDCIQRGINPYLESPDGHPSPAGQHAVATAVVTHPDVKKLLK